MTFVNTDKAGVTNALKVLDSVNISGEDWQLSAVYSELLTLRTLQQESVMANSTIRYQNLKIYEGEDLDSVSINMNLIPANVTAGKNAIVIRRFHTCENTIKQALVREQKETHKAIAKAVPPKGAVKHAVAKALPFTKFSR